MGIGRIGRLGRLQQSHLRAALPALLLACAAAWPLAARGQAASVQVPYGLGGSPPWHEHIGLGVEIWTIAHENARRALLIQRCSALERQFPARPAPLMVAASDAVYRWMTGAAYFDLPAEPYSAALREVLPVVARHAFTTAELASWDVLRETPNMRRGRALAEVEAGLVKVADRLVDVNTGRLWAWPLARLIRLADAQGLGGEIDAALNTLEPSAATRIRAISLVPGETQPDEGFLNLISRSGDRLAQTFVERLSPADRERHARASSHEVLHRWNAVNEALIRFGMGPQVVAMMRGQPPPATPEAFCDNVNLPVCQPGSELHQALTTYRKAFNEAVDSLSPHSIAKQIVRELPSSGCP
jgi:hypothetical protein